MVGEIMAKYSIVIPVYNAGPYLSRCLESVLNQSISDFEVVIINDGSTDNSEEVINSFQDDRIKYFKKENGGVSDARNFGVDQVQGDYFMFVDADDYVSSDLLGVIDKKIKAKTDVLSFNISLNDKFDKLISRVSKPVFDDLDGGKAIIRFIEKGTLFDTPVAYVYKTSFFKENDFKYAKERVHEDFGLTPLVLIKARSITAIGSTLYYYVLNDNGITRADSEEKRAKRARDMLFHFDYLYLNVNSDVEIEENVKKVFNSFIANAIIMKAPSLKGSNLRKYIQELKNRNVSALLLSDNMTRRMKKVLIKLNVKLYLTLFAKRRR